jgi:hypothetical protein
VSKLLLLGPGAGCLFCLFKAPGKVWLSDSETVIVVRDDGVDGVGMSKNAAARQSKRFIRRSWHNACVTHCLSAQEAVIGGTKSKT